MQETCRLRCCIRVVAWWWWSRRSRFAGLDLAYEIYLCGWIRFCPCEKTSSGRRRRGKGLLRVNIGTTLISWRIARGFDRYELVRRMGMRDWWEYRQVRVKGRSLEQERNELLMRKRTQVGYFLDTIRLVRVPDQDGEMLPLLHSCLASFHLVQSRSR